METHSRETIWNETLALIAARVNQGTYRIWFAQTVGMGFVDRVFVVGVSSDFAKDWIETRFRALIQDALSEVLGDAVLCRLVVDPTLAENGGDGRGEPAAVFTDDDSAGGRAEPAAATEETSAPMDASAPPAQAAGPTSSAALVGHGDGKPVPSGIGIGLSEKYTFDSFVIGPSNRFAHAAALAVAESPRARRTTRSSCTAASVSARHTCSRRSATTSCVNAPELKVRFVTIEMFTNDFINSVRENKMEDFKRRFRSNDVLLIDDIQFLETQGADAGGVLSHLQHAARCRANRSSSRATVRPTCCTRSKTGWSTVSSRD